jgi:hypothetical protein
VGLSNTGTATTPDGFTTAAAGTYEWTASYPGDDNNGSAASGCTKEAVVIAKNGPALNTVPSPASGNIGAVLKDTATLTGGSNPIGSITFQLYGPNDLNCSGAVIHTETIPLSGAKATTTGDFPTVAAGTYEWTASYPGDDNNSPASSGCGKESVVVDKYGPAISTTLSKSRAEVGTAIHDSATLTGVTADAGGTVKYSVFSDAACSAGTHDAGTVNVTNGSVSISNDIVFNNVGTWYWQAVYSGDGNNAGATSACTEETLVIDPSQTPFMSFKGATATPKATPTPTPTPTATATPTIIIGGQTGTPRAQTLPPTSSDHGSSSGGPTPLFAFAICLLFAGLGLLGVQSQLRSMRH